MEMNVMKNRLVVLLLLALSSWFAFAQTANPASALQVGAASETVNPPLGTLLGGYDRNRKSTGVHDDLSARSVIFSDGATAVALVAVDNFSLPSDITQPMRDAASRAVTKIKLPPSNVIVQATHTHAAPDNTASTDPRKRKAAAPRPM
jgi:neutral ceramidase